MGGIKNPGHRWCTLFVLVSMLMLVSGCSMIEQRVVYGPGRYLQSWEQPTRSEVAGLNVEEVQFRSLDGTRLYGWFVQPAHVEPENVILFAHGRSENVSSLKSRLFEFVKRHQVAVLVFDYRGYGKSDGNPSETGLYDDFTAARDWLAHRTGIQPSEVIMMGRSLGAAVAIDVAARDGAKALIVESGFTSLPDVVRHHTRNLLAGNFFQAKFESQRKIGKFSGPVFISHGKSDKVIPESQGIRLAQAARNASSVQFVEVEGGHSTPPSEAYAKKLDEFLKRL
jgi:pimeloyl-ACP methyl ester carboxylesterase